MIVDHSIIGVAWVGELGGKVVGHVLITTPQDGDAAAKAWADEDNPVESTAVLGRLFVLPEARGHSLGKQLVRATSAYADEQGALSETRAATSITAGHAHGGPSF